jgi:hypothetical protein
LPPSGQTPVQAISIQDFFDLDWVNAPGARPEILYLRRMKGDASHSTHGTGNGTSNEKMKGIGNCHAKVLGQKKPAESHVAFPGGRMEAEDEDGLYTGKKTAILWILPFFLTSASPQPCVRLGKKSVLTSPNGPSLVSANSTIVK